MPPRVESKQFHIMVGDQIRKKRREKGLSQVRVAEVCQMSQSYISELESGVASPSIASLLTVCDVLGISFAEVARQAEAVARK